MTDFLSLKPDLSAWEGYSLWRVSDSNGGSEMVRIPSERTGEDAIAFALDLPNSKVSFRFGRVGAELIA